MNVRHWRMTAAAAILAVSACVVLVGCPDERNNCENFNTCPSTGPGGTGGGGGSTDPWCVPHEAPNGIIRDDCPGIFVDAANGDDSAAGTRAAPVQTLTHALELAAASELPVYACNGAPFDESVTVPPGVHLYGGMDCSWKYDATPTAIQPMTPSTVAVLVLDAGDGARLEDLLVEAPDGAAPGGSSIAVFANETTASVVRCQLISGAGAPGEDGEDGAMLDDDTDNDGTMGASGTIMPVGLCNMQLHQGGMGGPKTCDGADVSGGNGGGAIGDPGLSGMEGKPNGFAMEGNGGLGQNIGLMTGCQSGQQGHQGQFGDDGMPAMGLGELTETGFGGTAGTSGTNGAHGQGGGGGGASACTAGNTGPSGGGGGSGGCGGKGAAGGSAGGSSFALLSFASTVTVSASSLVAGTGEEGGAGGDGQLGGSGGAGGPQAGGACSGGNGGNGGNGGHGGGGRGGHSAAVAFIGTAPELGDSTTMAGNRGTGGPGGGGVAALDGEDGEACPVLDLGRGCL
jgi:hypothetical protein